MENGQVDRTAGAGRRYRSETDLAIGSVLAVTVALTLLLSFWAVTSADPAKVRGGLTALVTLPVLGVLLFPVRYVIGGDSLNVRAGLLRWRVPFSGIVRVSPSRSSISSPALSRDRLAIEYRQPHSRSILYISPARRTDFLEHLAKGADLVWEGESLVPNPVACGEHTSREPR